ncbi:hypothetical protein [Streptomyces sp. NPDC059651]|uniref:hypothetical protein n=1 Tax=Streptomyces sp. NPDC059651 TaxID=3346897 RepID=UPI0036CC8716
MFRLVELAVREHWRGQGIVRRLHEALLDSIEAERVLLNATRAAGQQGSVSCLSGVGIPQVDEARPWGTNVDLLQTCRGKSGRSA